VARLRLEQRELIVVLAMLAVAAVASARWLRRE
jgi:hypothetical protein